MRHQRAFGAVVTAVVAGCVLAACAAPGNGPGTAPTSPASSTSSASASPSQTSLSPRQSAEQGARAVLSAYVAAVPRCLGDPSTTQPDCFDATTVGTEKTNMRNALVAAQQQGTRAAGEIKLVSADPERVDLTRDATAKPPVVPTVVFRVCYDVSGLSIVDKAGKSVVPAQRKPRGVQKISVYNYRYPDPAAWRVGLVEEVSNARC